MSKRYMVTNHEYFNSGGGCMISIFNVYDAQTNTTKYVIANEEGFCWQTADTVSGDNSEFFTDLELLNKVVIGHWDWDALTSEPSFDQHQFTDEEWELFKYCQFEWYKREQRHTTAATTGLDRIDLRRHIQIVLDHAA